MPRLPPFGHGFRGGDVLIALGKLGNGDEDVATPFHAEALPDIRHPLQLIAGEAPVVGILKGQGRVIGIGAAGGEDQGLFLDLEDGGRSFRVPAVPCPPLVRRS